MLIVHSTGMPSSSTCPATRARSSTASTALAGRARASRSIASRGSRRSACGDSPTARRCWAAADPLPRGIGQLATTRHGTIPFQAQLFTVQALARAAVPVRLSRQIPRQMREIRIVASERTQLRSISARHFDLPCRNSRLKVANMHPRQLVAMVACSCKLRLPAEVGITFLIARVPTACRRIRSIGVEADVGAVAAEQ